VSSAIYIIGPPCIGTLDRSCVDVCPVEDCILEIDQMLVINPDTCIGCSACEAECPVEAIVPETSLPREWEPFRTINQSITEGRDAANALVARYLEGAQVG
jgi:NAD-dependent dihydropyrimidine dehydrogenase PreA subunit